MSKIAITKVTLIFYLLVPSIEIGLKYFLEKNPQEQPQWAGGGGSFLPLLSSLLKSSS